MTTVYRFLKRAILGYLLLQGPLMAQEKYEAAWDSVVKAHVKSGIKKNLGKKDIRLNLVDYAGIKADPHYLSAVREVENFNLASLTSREKKLVFWINAYNIAAVKLIVESSGVASIKDVGSIISSVWKKQALRIQGKAFSIDYLDYCWLLNGK